MVVHCLEEIYPVTGGGNACLPAASHLKKIFLNQNRRKGPIRCPPPPPSRRGPCRFGGTVMQCKRQVRAARMTDSADAARAACDFYLFISILNPPDRQTDDG